MSIEVHIDWEGGTHLVGTLFPAERGAAVSFEYSSRWLRWPESFSIDPTSLPLRPGLHHSATLFGAIQDCGPDRWGRVLVERAVRKKLLAGKPYRDIDYVLALDDNSRIGALRFRADTDNPFLASSTGVIPPVIRLAALLRAADAIHSEAETANDLRFLLGEGSPLGGARPKSAVALEDGSLAIAKFPKPDDTRDIGAGEILALEIARNAGIHTVDYKRVPVGHHSVVVIPRFDRISERRIPFISASSLLGLNPSESGSYTMMADAIRQFGGNVNSDLRDLWRRLILSLLLSNNDDHMRNHGFLMRERGRWSLSPAYDINPVPEIDRARINKTPITDENEDSGVHVALSAAARFGLNAQEAKTILGEVVTAVSAWREAGRRLRIKATTLDTYASAFANPHMMEAERLIGETSLAKSVRRRRSF
jgi:serine/threonine-protein kinase HipA